MTTSEDKPTLPDVPTVDGEIVTIEEQIKTLKRKVDRTIEELGRADRQYHRKHPKRRGKR